VSDPAEGPGHFPDFYLVGHQKCGTTALYVMLGEHPEIFLPAVKEPKYFAADLRSVRAPSGPPNPLHSEQGYLALYAGAAAGQLSGDASPQYLRSVDAPAAIAAARPDAKIIAVFREPADFLRSFHEQMVSSWVEDQTELRRALELQDERRAGRSIPDRCHHPLSLQYYEHVHYAEQLQRYRDHFPAENIHVIVYDDLRADNERAVRGMLSFLGVDETFDFTARRTGPVHVARSRRVNRIAGTLRRARRRPERHSPAARMAGAVVPVGLLKGPVRTAWHRVAFVRPEPPDEQLAAELRERFRGEVQALGTMLDRDLLTLWGYGGDS